MGHYGGIAVSWPHGLTEAFRRSTRCPKCFCSVGVLSPQVLRREERTSVSEAASGFLQERAAERAAPSEVPSSGVSAPAREVTA